MTNALYRGGRKPDLYVPQRRPSQDDGQDHCRPADMDGDMRALAQQTLSKLERMTDADYDNQKFNFTDE